MSDPTPEERVALAEARAAAARARLADTIGALQRRARPQVLAKDVANTIRGSGRKALDGALANVKRRPLHLGLAVILLGLVLARRPLLRMARRHLPFQTRKPSPPSLQEHRDDRG